MITTYESTCSRCLSGEIHPTHDSGEPVQSEETDPRFSQIPNEAQLPVHRGTRCAHCGCHKLLR